MRTLYTWQLARTLYSHRSNVRRSKIDCASRLIHIALTLAMGEEHHGV